MLIKGNGPDRSDSQGAPRPARRNTPVPRGVLARMRVPFFVLLLALSACGLYDDSTPAEGFRAAAGGGGEPSVPSPSVECAPQSLGSRTGELVPTSALTTRGVVADGCDASFAGDLQYSWAAPAAGCYTISTFPRERPAKTTLKITRDTCDGGPVLCVPDNYGYSGQLGPFAQGERVVIALTNTGADRSTGNYLVGITGPRQCIPF